MRRTPIAPRPKVQPLTVSNILHRIEDGALIAALASMLIMAMVQIFLRNFFDYGLLWVEPFLRILVLWVAVLGGMVATREGNHISIDAVIRYLPPMAKRGVTVLASLASAGICATIAYTSVEFIRYEYEDGTIAFGVVPTWICQAILPFGFGVMALRFLIGSVFALIGRTNA